MNDIRNKEENLTTNLDNQDTMRLTKNIKISAKLHSEIMEIKKELTEEDDRFTTVDYTIRQAIDCLKKERLRK